MGKYVYLAILVILILILGCEKSIVKTPEPTIKNQSKQEALKPKLKVEPINLFNITTEKIELSKF